MGIFKKAFNGITEKTVQSIQLDAGVFFKDYDPNTDTYASAKEAGKCLGATQGGGSFTATPTWRNIDVDGAVGRVRGLSDIETWEVSMSATVIETTVDTIKLALGAATASRTDTPEGYTKIVGNSGVSDDDYIDNITWVGNISGSDKPIIIVLHNAINEGGLSYTVAPRSEGKVSLQLYGYNDINDFMTDTVNPPFDIYYPDVAAAETTTTTTETTEP